MEWDLRIVRGRPDDNEIAALVSVLFRRPADPAGPPVPAGSRWAASTRPGHRSGRLGRPGRDAWRASTRPR